ncbi:MAG: rod shape-determining protein MreD [Defluviitaleaceae bacterium]|nr:rod shape-determining protein MreD [Defluviitaleaceae bacterium]
MRRAIITAALVLVNFILQTTVFQYITIMDVRPNTALIIVVSYAVLRGDVEGAIVGFCAGLLQDIYFNPVIGFTALLYMLIGYFCGKPLRDFYKENYFLAVLLIAASALFYQFAYYFAFFLFRGKVDIQYYFRDIMLPGAIYTFIVSLPLYGLMYMLNRRLERRESGEIKRFKRRKAPVR